MDELAWTCHICKQIRPNDKIDVVTGYLLLENGISENTQINIRYCNDRLDCRHIAHTHAYKFYKFPTEETIRAEANRLKGGEYIS